MPTPPHLTQHAWLAALLCAASLACDRSEPPPAPTHPTPPAPTAPAPQTDPELNKALTAITTRCAVIEMPYGNPRECSDDPLGHFNRRARELGPVASLHTTATAMLAEDPKQAAVAANRLHNVVTPLLREVDPTQKAVHGETVTLLFKSLDQLAPEPLQQAAEAIVLAAYLADRQEELLGHLEQLASSSVRAEAYRHLTTFGRLEALPTLKQLAQDHDVGLVSAALDAPRQLPAPTDAELGQLCSWAASYLPHNALRVAEAAGKTMAWCGGPYIQTLLAEGQRRLKARRLLLPFSRVYRAICEAPRATPSQCERNLVFLRGIVDDPAVPVRVRTDALWNIYLQRRSPETLALMRAWSKSDNTAIRDRAARAVFLMTRSPDTPMTTPPPPPTHIKP